MSTQSATTDFRPPSGVRFHSADRHETKIKLKKSGNGTRTECRNCHGVTVMPLMTFPRAARSLVILLDSEFGSTPMTFYHTAFKCPDRDTVLDSSFGV
jgi:hypothetical protein